MSSVRIPYFIVATTLMGHMVIPSCEAMTLEKAKEKKKRLNNRAGKDDWYIVQLYETV